MTASHRGFGAGIYGYRLDSDLPLTRLRSWATERGSISVQAVDEDLLAEPAEIVALIEGPNQELRFAIARTANSLLTWCRDSGSSRVDAAAGRIWVRPEGDPGACEDRLLNTLIPLLLAARGELILHAAVIETERGAVAVCGPSGRGKSTLAVVLGSQGLPILAEDAVALTWADDQVLAWPGPVGARLDSVTTQALGQAASAAVRGKQIHLPPTPLRRAAPVPVVAVVALDPRGGSELEVRALGGPQGLAAIFFSVGRLEIATWPPVFRWTAELVRRVRCYSARLPDDLDRVTALAPQLMAEVTWAPQGRPA